MKKICVVLSFTGLLFVSCTKSEISEEINLKREFDQEDQNIEIGPIPGPKPCTEIAGYNCPVPL